jgi:hypothetical protein
MRRRLAGTLAMLTLTTFTENSASTAFFTSACWRRARLRS